MWLPQATRGLPNIPLLGPEAAGLDQVRGLNAGLISQNADPPYAADNVKVLVHWLKDAPLRPAPLRSPGKPANCFAVESFIDELAAAARVDPVEFRLRGLSDARGLEVIKRTAALMKWQPRPSPGPDKDAPIARGRGLAYVHYKHDETYVAMGMEVAVERCILQTLSRALKEEVKFDRSRVLSVDWSTYPILTFSEAPKLEIELIDRPTVPPVGAGEAACTPV